MLDRNVLAKDVLLTTLAAVLSQEGHLSEAQAAMMSPINLAAQSVRQADALNAELDRTDSEAIAAKVVYAGSEFGENPNPPSKPPLGGEK